MMKKRTTHDYRSLNVLLELGRFERGTQGFGKSRAAHVVRTRRVSVCSKQRYVKLGLRRDCEHISALDDS